MAPNCLLFAYFLITSERPAEFSQEILRRPFRVRAVRITPYLDAPRRTARRITRPPCQDRHNSPIMPTGKGQDPRDHPPRLLGEVLALHQQQPLPRQPLVVRKRRRTGRIEEPLKNLRAHTPEATRTLLRNKKYAIQNLQDSVHVHRCAAIDTG
jgi:hypothetical protein